MPDTYYHNFNDLIGQSSFDQPNSFLNKNYSGLINIALKENNIYLINVLFELLPASAFVQMHLSRLTYKLNINRINILVKYEAKIDILDKFMEIIREEDLLTNNIDNKSLESLNTLNEKLQSTAKNIYQKYREKLQNEIFKFTERSNLKIYYEKEFRLEKAIKYVENAGKSSTNKSNAIIDLDLTKKKLSEVGIDSGSSEKRHQLMLKRDSITDWIAQTNVAQFLALDLDEYLALYDNFVKKEFGVMFKLGYSTLTGWEKVKDFFGNLKEDEVNAHIQINKNYKKELLEQFVKDKHSLMQDKYISGHENYTEAQENANYYLKEKRLIEAIYEVKIGNYEFDLNNAILNQLFARSKRTPTIAILYDNADGKSETEVTSELKAFLKNLKFHKQADIVNIANIILQDFYKKAIILNYEINAKNKLVNDLKNKKKDLDRIPKLEIERNTKEDELKLVEKIILSLALRGANIQYPNISNDKMDIIYETEINGKREKIEKLGVKIANEIEKTDQFKLIFQKLAQKEFFALYEYLLEDSFFLKKYNKFNFTENDIINFIPHDAEKALHKIFNKIKELEKIRYEMLKKLFDDNDHNLNNSLNYNYDAKRKKKFSITYSWKKFFRWTTRNVESLDTSLENFPAEVDKFKKDFFSYYLEDSGEDLLENYHICVDVKKSTKGKNRLLVSELEVALEEFYKEMEKSKQAEKKINTEITKAQFEIKHSKSEDNKTEAQNKLREYQTALNNKKLELLKKYGSANRVKTIDQYNLSIVGKVEEYFKKFDSPDYQLKNENTVLQEKIDKTEQEAELKFIAVEHKVEEERAAREKAEQAEQTAKQALFKTYKKFCPDKTDPEIMIMVENELRSTINENNPQPSTSLNHFSSTESLSKKQSKYEASLRYMKP